MTLDYLLMFLKWRKRYIFVKRYKDYLTVLWGKINLLSHYNQVSMETPSLSKNNTKITDDSEDPINTEKQHSQESSFIKTTVTRFKAKIHRDKQYCHESYEWKMGQDLAKLRKWLQKHDHHGKWLQNESDSSSRRTRTTQGPNRLWDNSS